MTTKTFINRMSNLGYYVQNLEPDELNVQSKNTKLATEDGWLPELFDIDMTRPHNFGVDPSITHIPDKVMVLVKEYADTPIKQRKQK